MASAEQAGPVRIGLAGYGFGGRRFHAPFIAAAAGCELAAVVTRDPEKRALLAREHPGARAIDAIDELLELGLDGIVVSTPADTHTLLARRAIERDIAVVVDKPFALDAATAQETVAMAAGRGVPLTVYQNRRWDSDFLTVRRLASDGSLGELTRLESRFERHTAGPGAAGGGTLLDLGSHLVDQALQLLGPVRSVYAELHRRPDLDSRDDDVFFALTHERGALAHLWASHVQFAPGPRFRVTGTKATCIIDAGDGQEAALLDGVTPAAAGDAWGVEPSARWGRLHTDSATHPVQSERGRWDTFYPAFARAIHSNGPVPVDPHDAVRTAAVLDAARVSAAQRRTVELEPPGS